MPLFFFCRPRCKCWTIIRAGKGVFLLCYLNLWHTNRTILKAAVQLLSTAISVPSLVLITKQHISYLWLVVSWLGWFSWILPETFSNFARSFERPSFLLNLFLKYLNMKTSLGFPWVPTCKVQGESWIRRDMFNNLTLNDIFHISLTHISPKKKN